MTVPDEFRSILYRLSFELRLPDPLLRDELSPDEFLDLITLLPDLLFDRDLPTDVPEEPLFPELDLLILLPDPLDRLEPLLEVPLDLPTFPELLPTELDLPVLRTRDPLLILLLLTEDPLVLGV